MARRLIAIGVLALAVCAVLAPVAVADTGDIIAKQNDPSTDEDGFQAGTCTTDTPQCSPETKENFFTQAGGHPPIGFTQYIVKQMELESGEEIPVGSVETIRVDLPPGLTVNPEATIDGEGNPIRCTMAQFNTPVPPFDLPGCPPETLVGEELVTLKVVLGPTAGEVKPPIPGVTQVPVYNLEPEFGEPAKFGFKIGAPGPTKRSVFLKTDVAWENDFHEGFTIELPEPSPGTLTWKSRLVNFGDKTGDGTYITNPTTCFSPVEFPNLYSTWLRALPTTEAETEAGKAFPVGYTPFEAKLPEGVEVDGCELVPFEPGIGVTAGTSEVDSPAPATVTATLPFDPAKEGDTGISQSQVRSARVTMPAGMGINPSGANGLLACTDAQFAKGVRIESNSCPPESDIGTVEVETPPLPPGALKGDVYVGEQKSRDPASGETFRILVEAKSEQYGVVARLIGNVIANPVTGQLTAVLDEQEVGQFSGVLPKGLPQVPFESVTLRFDGSKHVLTSPPVCGSHTTTTALEPWARPGTAATPSSSFALSSIPGGGTCPTTMADRPFAPGYAAKSDNTQGGAYSPFRVRIARPDGQQELKVVDVTLPEGLTGKLAGIPYCSEAALAAAANGAGRTEQASPSCSAASQIGNATTRSGTGAEPILISGKAYLAGPYKGAPLSLAVITPAVAGPFDLGTVVVRVALFVDPKTTQVKAVSDAIPDVFGGAKLDLRTIDVDVDRRRFMRNPTDCSAFATSGVIKGGGADPTNPATFSSYAVSAPFQATNCGKLRFRPKLFTRLFGGGKSTFRGQHPKFRAVLEAREGDANMARSALVLPHSLFLDQSNIRTVCTRPQLASRTCPKAAIYGHAKARTPLLDNPLKGPVYLVSSDNQLPDLVADLRGQVNVQLSGVISSKRGGLKTVFRKVPDVPVKKFILWMKGGRNQGLIVNSTDLCNRRQGSFMNLKAQNGKKVKTKRLKLRVDGCRKRR